MNFGSFMVKLYLILLEDNPEWQANFEHAHEEVAGRTDTRLDIQMAPGSCPNMCRWNLLPWKLWGKLHLGPR